jgi:predicted esterase
LLAKEAVSSCRIHYLAYLPKQYDADSRHWPLLLFLHGAGESGDDLSKVRAKALPQAIESGREFPFIVIAPQSPTEQWETSPLIALLDDIISRYRVDEDSVHVTGLSSGGWETFELAALHPHRFAAIAPLCGGGELSWVSALKDVPIWCFHGCLDTLEPVASSIQMVEAVNAAGGNAALTVYPELGHKIWSRTYSDPELYLWFLRHHKDPRKARTMRVHKTDIISFFDIDFKKTSLHSRDLLRLKSRAITDRDAAELYEEAFGWIYYGSALPGCQRIFYRPSQAAHSPTFKCCTLLVRPANGAGVLSIWSSFGPDIDPFTERQRDLYADFIPWVKDVLGQDMKTPDRVYPFVTLTVDSDDLADYTLTNTEELGKIFTGYFEEDEREYLVELMKNNLSKRRYERLFLRWTDVLAIYSSRIGTEQQEKTMLRAAQLYETCILVNRLCKNLSDEADALSSKLRFPLPRPWSTDRILKSFLEIERQFLVAPPVQSVEAGGLLNGTYKSFGIDDVLGGARNSCQFLESRFQWSKTQFLVTLGLLAYLLDKFEVFKCIAQQLPWKVVAR